MSSGSVVDGVQRCPVLGLKVVVIGAGVGGLWTALECWRKGCDVVVLEKAKDTSPLGDFFTVPPSGLSALHYYPSMFRQYDENVYNCTTSIWTPQGKCVKSVFPEWLRVLGEKTENGVKVSFLNHRPAFARMLLDQCKRLGIPILFSHETQEVTEEGERVVARTPQGDTFEGDICVVANGIGKPSIKDINGVDRPVLDSGYAIARMAFPTASIPKDSLAFRLIRNVDTQPEFRVYLGDDVHLILFLTKDRVAFAFTHEGDGDAAESWHKVRDSAAIIKSLQQRCADWDPAVMDFMERTPGQVVDWGLRWRDPAEKWTSEGGRIVALGDAAHAFLPTAGNGAVMACEDAVSLAECLRQGGRDAATWATRVHNHLRFERVSILQQAGFINREELHHANLEEIAAKPAEATPGFFTMGRWVWGHNPELYAAEKYAACLDHVRNGAEFRNTNLPPGHVYRPWSLESENARMKAGLPSDLKSNGYWGPQASGRLVLSTLPC